MPTAPGRSVSFSCHRCRHQDAYKATLLCRQELLRTPTRLPSENKQCPSGGAEFTRCNEPVLTQPAEQQGSPGGTWGRRSSREPWLRRGWGRRGTSAALRPLLLGLGWPWGAVGAPTPGDLLCKLHRQHLSPQLKAPDHPPARSFTSVQCSSKFRIFDSERNLPKHSRKETERQEK